jgi:hypothetical protein
MIGEQSLYDIHLIFEGSVNVGLQCGFLIGGQIEGQSTIVVVESYSENFLVTRTLQQSPSSTQAPHQSDSYAYECGPGAHPEPEIWS